MPRGGPVKIREGRIDDLVALYTRSYAKIVKEIVDFADTDVVQRARVMARINAELTQLGIDVNEWVGKEIPQYYLDGANQAIQDLRALGIDVSKKSSMAVINREAIKALTDDVALAFAEGIRGVSRSANIKLSDIAKRKINFTIAEGKITGEARRTISAAVKQELAEQGLSALKDARGRSWTLDRYSRMLVRTKAVEARNQGLTNRMLEEGYDLVQVSNHGSQHEACARWEGEILSLTGQTDGYPTLDEAEGDGLFHPNCEHAINVITQRLASKTEAYENPYNDLSAEDRREADAEFANRNATRGQWL